MSQTPMKDGSGVNQDLSVRACREKERDAAVKEGHTNVSQNSSWTKVYVLPPEEEHKQRN